MLPFALKIAWFSLSLSGLFCCCLVLLAFARCVGPYACWGPLIYVAASVLLHGVFCLGIIWRMDPSLMPRGFCIAQSLLVGFATFLLTGVAAAFSVATSLAVLKPKTWGDNGKTALAWRRVYIVPVAAFPIMASAAQIAVVFRYDAVRPTGDFHCDAGHPIWARFFSYAGTPLLLSLPCLALSIQSILRIYSTNRHIRRAAPPGEDDGAGLVGLGASGSSAGKVGRALGIGREGHSAALGPGVLGWFGASKNSTRAHEEHGASPSFATDITAAASEQGPRVTHRASSSSSLRFAPVALGYARGYSRPAPAPNPGQRAGDGPGPDSGLVRHHLQEQEQVETPVPAVRRVGTGEDWRDILGPAEVDPRGEYPHPYQVGNGGGRKGEKDVVEMEEMVLAETEYDVGFGADGGKGDWGDENETEDELADSKGGDNAYHLRGLRLADTKTLALGVPRKATVPSGRRPRPPPPSLAPAIWRIIVFQLTFITAQVLSCISTIVDVATHRTAPSPFGTQHVALLIAAWGPVAVFGHLPCVRRNLAFWRPAARIGDTS